jgi:hypothetical protein
MTEWTREWTHRIDEVPDVGRRIAFKHTSEPDAVGRTGRVVRAADNDVFYGGVGDDVRIDPDDSTGVLLIPSLTFAWWRYIE